jgi:hypothetical protein
MGEILNRNKSQTIGAANAMVSDDMYGATRKMITIVNTSAAAQTISIAIGEEAVAGSGIVLYPTGSWSEGTIFAATQKIINVISSAAGGTIAVYERIEV